MMTSLKRLVVKMSVLLGMGAVVVLTGSTAEAQQLTLADAPLFLTQTAPPLTLLILGRDHKLYYEAYSDYSDLNNDGVIDIRYKPTQVDYFGYFDSYKCYTSSAIHIVAPMADSSPRVAPATNNAVGNGAEIG